MRLGDRVSAAIPNRSGKNVVIMSIGLSFVIYASLYRVAIVFAL